MKLFAYTRFFGIFVLELVRSSLAVSRAILSGDRSMRSAVVAIPLDLEKRADAALVANAVTLTPGTTSLHLSEDGRSLYVHVMDWAGDEATVDAIKSRFERVLKEA
ncbi:Na+/H+ antiporter subunit E [Amorphus orientalis]|uniref:Multicomponent Na+:H+ antiporter subunit E n=1 Tax=Amorphus orientalis TaxID=649198 RepID=A0AAE3VTE2_9HYPH|nr:Na+/H+ antiporter subunit E [Amorphus orientalis]MDQ0317485.1 multicomponent Na+:H+ antiporter subunit E [Amorphus orientalis]